MCSGMLIGGLGIRSCLSLGNPPLVCLNGKLHEGNHFWGPFNFMKTIAEHDFEFLNPNDKLAKLDTTHLKGRPLSVGPGRFQRESCLRSFISTETAGIIIQLHNGSFKEDTLEESWGAGFDFGEHVRAMVGRGGTH